MEDYSAEFDLSPTLAYLNHAAVSPWPRRAAAAVRAFADENLRQGSLDYPRWLQVESALRDGLRQLINAPSADDIALVKNTSEGLSFVAAGLAWHEGDNVVTSDQEFPSNRIVWESLAERGVTLREVDLSAASSPEEALFAAVDERTRLLAISSVQYASGLRLDLEAIGRFCQANGILFCVDAIQSVGAEPIDVQRIEADFLAADGHKWMLGPEGMGLFYVRPDLREQLRLTQFGWHMVANPGDYSAREWHPATTARRFECGSPNMLGIHTLEASVSLLLEVGLETVSREVREKSRYLMAQIATAPQLELITPPSAERHLGIVTLRHRTRPADALLAELTAAGVFCAARGGGIRLSPHYYTPRAHLDRALNLLTG